MIVADPIPLCFGQSKQKSKCFHIRLYTLEVGGGASLDFIFHSQKYERTTPLSHFLQEICDWIPLIEIYLSLQIYTWTNSLILNDWVMSQAIKLSKQMGIK